MAPARKALSVFAWYGFQVSHSEDWSVSGISGGRREGYARISSSDPVALQIRWKSASEAGDLSSKLDAYLAKLKRDAGKARVAFSSERKPDEAAIAYRWVGAGQGRGAIFFSVPCKRIFFLEVIGERRASLLPIFRSCMDSFASDRAAKRERWSINSLDILLPADLTVEKRTLLAGRTGLSLARRGLHVEAERWGFAEQLLAKHGIGDWAAAALAMKAANREEGEGCVRLTQMRSLRPPSIAVVQFQRERNQLVAIKTTTRDREIVPNWDWIL